MSLAVYSFPEPLYAYAAAPRRATVVAQFAGGENEQRAVRTGRVYRRYTVGFGGLSTAERDLVEAFFVARSMRQDSFLFLDPEDCVRNGIATEPATSNGTTTIFSLPTTGENAGAYPVADGRTALFRSGVQVPSVTVSTDGRTLTAAAAPLTGGAMTCCFAFYRRMRLEAEYEWHRDDSGLWSTSMAWTEVPA